MKLKGIISLGLKVKRNEELQVQFGFVLYIWASGRHSILGYFGFNRKLNFKTEYDMSSQGDDFRDAKAYGIKTAEMPWGKHKGEKIIEMPYNYLKWLRNSEHFEHLDYDQKNAVKSIL